MPGERTLHVLVVDPDDARRGAAADVLRSVGCWVDELRGPAEALEAARREQPSVIVVDEEGCRGDGVRMLDAVKRDPDLFAIGVVVRARRLDVDTALDGLGRGAHGVLVDPVADAELVATVRSAARTGDLQAELRNRAVELERLAFTDALTDVPNRRFIERQLAALVSGARRHGRPLAAALIDIDRFKPINDTHGHAVGDAVIAEVARRLGARLRAEDHLGRFGGDEFLVLLAETNAAAAAAVAEDLRAGVAVRPVATAAGHLHVTTSVGWAVWDGEPGHGLLSRADAALYAAKQAGRDRVRGAPSRRATEERSEP